MWQYEHKQTADGETLYRVYSTIVSDYITDWVKRHQVLATTYNAMGWQFKIEVIKMYMTFPQPNAERLETYHAFLLEATSRSNAEFEDAVEHKYQEALSYMSGLSQTTEAYNGRQ